MKTLKDVPMSSIEDKEKVQELIISRIKYIQSTRHKGYCFCNECLYKAALIAEYRYVFDINDT